MASMTDDTAPFADPEGYEQAAELLASARRITVLTGAGVSTDSGIPDFRGPQGLWTTNPNAQAMSDIDTYMGDVDVRRQTWLARRAHQVWEAEPNAAHQALADLASSGRLHALVTQNIDGLHQRAGVPEEEVVEVHGTMLRVMCMACGLRTPSAAVLARLDDESDPRCAQCGGIQKSDTISFGQRLDPEVIERAAQAARECDVFMAVGTSLTVHPVAGLCDVAMMARASLLIVNAEPTPYDDYASAVLHDPIGDVVPALVKRALTG
ncbi:NAD-dependent protein deacetylase 2 [Nocardiopsis terrae]|uniref:protein acetyllysine N-acetyltransferase n=1 Tax=Nocardiopsis terrae TaxID=372655 RepID=A0ABR9HJD5_9ACTN|nr:Sir2 family NAD-dependent protein deacetylase [Nocardiopsis terrae]MBE1458970.1 NAD-dependent deacetylase [Nocardiopsis terrae]GHC87371.1 NAD-dependent protein deacetylase 2 [Nocardiopsis terrae]